MTKFCCKIFKFGYFIWFSFVAFTEFQSDEKKLMKKYLSTIIAKLKQNLFKFIMF